MPETSGTGHNLSWAHYPLDMSLEQRANQLTRLVKLVSTVEPGQCLTMTLIFSLIDSLFSAIDEAIVGRAATVT